MEKAAIGRTDGGVRDSNGKDGKKGVYRRYGICYSESATVTLSSLSAMSILISSNTRLK